MSFLSWMPFIPRSFMSRFWTTIGRTVYVPTQYDLNPNWGKASWRMQHSEVLGHEKVHVEQWESLGPLMWLLYIGPAPFLLPFIWIHPLYFGLLILLLSPLTCGLAVGRAFLEIEAYGTHIKDENGYHWVGQTLWRNYFFTLPPTWTAAWMKKRATRR